MAENIKPSLFSRFVALGQWALAIAIIYLSYSIYTFTQKVEHVIEVYPQFLSDVHSVTSDLKIEEWMAFSKSVEVLIPQIVDSVDRVQQTASDFEQTAASIDRKIPLIVEEVKLLRTETVPMVTSEIKAIRVESLPSFLKEAEIYRRDVIPPLLVESKRYRVDVVPAIVTESEFLRKEIPPLLDRADALVENSQVIVEKATKGAVEGTVKGVVLSPFTLMKEAKDGVTDRFSEE